MAAGGLNNIEKLSQSQIAQQVETPHSLSQPTKIKIINPKIE